MITFLSRVFACAQTNGLYHIRRGTNAIVCGMSKKKTHSSRLFEKYAKV